MATQAKFIAPRGSRDLVEIAVVLGVGATMIVIGSLAPEDSLLDRVALPLRTIALLALVSWFLHRAGEGWVATGLKAPSSPWRALGIIFGGYLLIAAVGSALIGFVFPALGWSEETTGAFRDLRGDVGAYLYWVAIAWTCAAIGEELIFRGFLFSRLERLLGRGRDATVLAVIAQALLFGLGHAYQGLSGIVLTGATGLILGAVYLASGRNLVTCIVLHGLVDTISLTAIFLGAL